jgi:hypothetical protein
MLKFFSDAFYFACGEKKTKLQGKPVDLLNKLKRLQNNVTKFADLIQEKN